MTVLFVQPKSASRAGDVVFHDGTFSDSLVVVNAAFTGQKGQNQA